MSKHKPGIKDLVDYVLEAECEDYFENGKPEGHPYQIARDNGLVMTAAPELKRALEDYVSLATTKEPYTHEHLQEALANAQAAIAKAEGR